MRPKVRNGVPPSQSGKLNFTAAIRPATDPKTSQPIPVRKYNTTGLVTESSISTRCCFSETSSAVCEANEMNCSLVVVWAAIGGFFENQILRSTNRFFIIKNYFRPFVQLLDRKLLRPHSPDESSQSKRTGNNDDGDNDNDRNRQTHNCILP